MAKNSKQERFLGLWDATGIGVGAIVGGGILALAGVAFATTGASAILAFALNGLIALITAISFAELATAFPESGGTYTFAKKVLSIKTAFAVGWIVYFASIVAAVLYALGFASYAVSAINHLCIRWLGTVPAWFSEPIIGTVLAIIATAIYTLNLIRKSAAGKQWATWGKILVFGVLIVCGFFVLAGKPLSIIRPTLTPFFPRGANGLFVAMGYTFVALQGFEFVAVVAGEVKAPERNIPRAMAFSLGLSLLIYLPFLFIITTVGVNPGESIVALSSSNPETIVAIAAQNYLGPVGFWFVTIAAILSMLTALRANLLAASWVILAMGRDRTLPRQLSRISQQHESPVAAIITTSFTVIIVLFIVPDLGSAGAAASLIFLISFALVHAISILARKRAGHRQPPFKSPWFPLIPVTGLIVCLALAVSQGFAVPSAGLITLVWLAIGGVLFISLFARHALIADASAEAWDPHLVRVRGRNPLILVPLANPDNAEAMVTVADALSPPEVGRVLLLSVVSVENPWFSDTSVPKPLVGIQKVLQKTLLASYASSIYPEVLITMSEKPWAEITRVANFHACESLLLGLSEFKEGIVGDDLENLMKEVSCDVIVLRAPKNWHVSNVRKILVPISGHGKHDRLRARLLTSLCRTCQREVTFLRIVPKHTSNRICKKVEKELLDLAEDEVRGCAAKALLIRSDVIGDELIKYVSENDMVILGLQAAVKGQKFFGDIVYRIARETQDAIIMINRH